MNIAKLPSRNAVIYIPMLYVSKSVNVDAMEFLSP